MKALIRNDGETVKETDGVVGIDWKNGEPLTRAEWAGGPYTLVDNYVEPDIAEDPAPAAEPVEEIPKTYHINGKTYTEDELRAMLNQ